MSVASDPRTQTSPFWIKLNGAELPESVTGQVMDLTIEQDLVLPDSFTLRIPDIADQPAQMEQSNFPLLEQDKFPIGGSIEIGLGREEHPASILKGDITSLEMDARGNGAPMLTVRGYDGVPSGETLVRLNRWMGARPFKVVVSQRFPLEEATAAHRAVTRHHLGKIALQIRQ